MASEFAPVIYTVDWSSVQRLAITIGAISLILKFAWSYMDAILFKRESGFITWDGLKEFCSGQQRLCPRSMDIEGIKVLGEAIKDEQIEINSIIQEQKKLRQETLPKEFVTVMLFKEAVESIKESIDRSNDNNRILIEKLSDRIDVLMSEGLVIPTKHTQKKRRVK